MATCLKLYVIAFFFVLSCGNSLLAQEFLNGKLIDGTAGDPISFATVKIKNKAIFSGQPIFDAEGIFNFWMNTPK